MFAKSKDGSNRFGELTNYLRSLTRLRSYMPVSPGSFIRVGDNSFSTILASAYHHELSPVNIFQPLWDDIHECCGLLGDSAHAVKHSPTLCNNPTCMQTRTKYGGLEVFL